MPEQLNGQHRVAVAANRDNPRAADHRPSSSTTGAAASAAVSAAVAKPRRDLMRRGKADEDSPCPVADTRSSHCRHRYRADDRRVPLTRPAVCRSSRRSRWRRRGRRGNRGATAPTVPCRRAASSSAMPQARCSSVCCKARQRASVRKYRDPRTRARGLAPVPAPPRRSAARAANAPSRRAPTTPGSLARKYPRRHRRAVCLLPSPRRPFPGSRRGEHSAPPGIEQRVVLQRDDRGGYRVKRAAAGGKDVAAGRSGRGAGHRDIARHGSGSSHPAAASRHRHGPPGRIRWS